MRTEALVLRANYLCNLLFGMDNTPLNLATEDRSNNIHVVYEDFLHAYPGTYAARLVRAQYDYLKKEGIFNKTFAGDIRSIPMRRYPEVKAWLERAISLDEYNVYIESEYRAVRKNAH